MRCAPLSLTKSARYDMMQATMMANGVYPNQKYYLIIEVNINRRLTNRLLDNTPGINPCKVELPALGQDDDNANDGCSDNTDCQ